MFKKLSANISNSDAIIRELIATILLVYALLANSYFFLLPSAILYLSSINRFCILYYLFNINERLSTKNYYISLLPKNNPSSVFIFDLRGRLVFQNDASKKEFTDISSPKSFDIQNFKDVIYGGETHAQMHEENDKHYLVELKGVSKEKLLLAYLTDVSEVIALNKEIEDTQKEIIYTMGEIGETRSQETGNHVKRVALYSKELGLLHGLSEQEAEILQMASPMHDIGKVGIPDSILNAPRKLDADEWKVMQTHADLGYKMLNKSSKPILKAAAIVAHEHHEKWDGTGYPRGVASEDIHIFGRITAIADVFDALGSERVYKKAWPLDQILEYFHNERGKHFDPHLVDLFTQNLDTFLAIRDKFQD